MANFMKTVIIYTEMLSKQRTQIPFMITIKKSEKWKEFLIWQKNLI